MCSRTEDQLSMYIDFVGGLRRNVSARARILILGCNYRGGEGTAFLELVSGTACVYSFLNSDSLLNEWFLFSVDM